MHEFITFFANHLFLATLWAAIAMLLVLNLVRTALSGIKSLGPQEATARINREEAVLVDLRSKAEFDKGHIAGSLNLPFEVFAKSGAAELESRKNRPIILACATGMQSGTAAMLLKKAGFADVARLAGGVPAWTGANLPLVKK